MKMNGKDFLCDHLIFPIAFFCLSYFRNFILIFSSSSIY